MLSRRALLIIASDIILGLHASGVWVFVFLQNYLGEMVWQESTRWIAVAEFYISILIFVFFLVQIPYWFGRRHER